MRGGGGFRVGSLFDDVILGCCFLLHNHLDEEGRDGCFTLNVLWLSMFCVSSS